jgi:hypothetical protein
MRVSCKKLAEMTRSGILPVLNFVKNNKDKTDEEFAKYIRGTCEAYGRDVRAYLHCGSMEKREMFERWMRVNDLDFDRAYSPGTPMVEIKVKYFKAWHWDE